MQNILSRQGLSAAAGLFGSGLGLGLGLGMASQQQRHASASSSSDARDTDAAMRMARIEKRCQDLELQCMKLERHVEELDCAKEVVRPPRDTVGHIVDAYVEWWYERNKKDVDVGIVELPVVGAVDLFPNAVEKQMYAQMFKAMVNQILDTELSVAGVKMRMEPVDLHKAFVPPVARPSARAHGD